MSNQYIAGSMTNYINCPPLATVKYFHGSLALYFFTNSPTIQSILFNEPIFSALDKMVQDYEVLLQAEREKADTLKEIFLSQT